VRHTTYDKEHTIHRILYKALLLLFQINSNPVLSSRLGALLLNFPEMSGIKITDALFEKLPFDRKTESYKNAIEIARLILLNYHPDVSTGQHDVLALMFDMNILWEQFVYVSLRKYKTVEMRISAQNPKFFWKSDRGSSSKMIPDIVLNKDKPNCVVLDTKWKNLNGLNPSPQDLRQMYVYMKYYKAVKVALVYPGAEKTIKGGKYFSDDTGEIGEEECSVISLSVNKDIKAWQKEIYDGVMKWCMIKSSEEV
jgi:5-methylcytosine-specific restriction enzyme subunit McrC